MLYAFYLNKNAQIQKKSPKGLQSFKWLARLNLESEFKPLLKPCGFNQLASTKMAK